MWTEVKNNKVRFKVIYDDALDINLNELKIKNKIISKEIKADLSYKSIEIKSADNSSAKILIKGDEKNLDLNKIILTFVV